jgi:hypothetical protein
MDDIQKVSGYHPYEQDIQKVSEYRPCPGHYTETFCLIIVGLLRFSILAVFKSGFLKLQSFRY